MNEFLAPRTLTERWGFLFEENPSVLPGLCILSGKRVYDTYYRGGNPDKIQHQRKTRLLKMNFFM
jgi:hypothetical protein